MKEKASQLKGAIWNTLGSTMNGANSFIMLALVSRVGTVEQAGYFSIAFTTAQILYIVGLFGVNTYQMTDYGEKYRFLDYAKVKAFSCFLMLVGCVLAALTMHFTGEKAVYLFSLTILMLLNTIGELYQSLFFQKKRLDLSGSALFWRTFWSLIAFCVTLIVWRNVFFAVVVQIVVNLITTLYYALSVASAFIPRPTPPMQYSSVSLALECLPLFLSMFMVNLIMNASKYGIEFLMDDSAQGYYSMIFMPAQVINLCSQFIFKPLLSKYAELFADHKDRDAVLLLLRQVAFVMGFTFICCAGTALLGPQVLGLLYGKDLSAFRLPLVLVVFGGGIFACCQLFYYIFVILRRQKWLFAIYSAALVVSVMVTIVLVSIQGITGAVLSFIVTHLFILILTVCALLLAVFLRGEHNV